MIAGVRETYCRLGKGLSLHYLGGRRSMHRSLPIDLGRSSRSMLDIQGLPIFLLLRYLGAASKRILFLNCACQFGAD